LSCLLCILHFLLLPHVTRHSLSIARPAQPYKPHALFWRTNRLELGSHGSRLFSLIRVYRR
jgi:hypothetical protein